MKMKCEDFREEEITLDEAEPGDVVEWKNYYWLVTDKPRTVVRLSNGAVETADKPYCVRKILTELTVIRPK